MSKPVIFTISAAWDAEASVWSGHCDDIPAAADAPTLAELLAKISAMALSLLPDNSPDATPVALFSQLPAWSISCVGWIRRSINPPRRQPRERWVTASPN